MGTQVVNVDPPLDRVLPVVLYVVALLLMVVGGTSATPAAAGLTAFAGVPRTARPRRIALAVAAAASTGQRALCCRPAAVLGARFASIRLLTIYIAGTLGLFFGGILWLNSLILSFRRVPAARRPPPRALARVTAARTHRPNIGVHCH